MTSEKQRLQDIRQARLLFQAASTLARLVCSSGEKVDFIGEFDWLFTKEELKEAKIRRLMSVLEK